MEAIECSEKLAEVDGTLRDATKFFLAHVRNLRQSSRTSEVISELLAARRIDGCSKRYLDDLRVRLGRFAADFGEQIVVEISGREVDDWLRGLPVGGVTRNTFRRRLSTLFGYAKKRGYLEVNPIGNVERAKEHSASIGILVPEEVERLLRTAQPAMVPFWAIGAFAGLRTAEIQRLTWGDVDLEGGYVEVKAANSKTAARRLVTIQPNLRAWLAPHALPRGAVTPSNFQACSKLDRQRAALLTAWPNNALRHSFASYHLAVFGDAAKLALEMGSSTRHRPKSFDE